jgi:hypothetical protein
MNKYKAYLRKRPHYGDMINEIELNPPKIKYPDRTATFLRNTHYMSRFDGDLGFIDLEDQESKMAKERQLQEDARNAARETNETHSLLAIEDGAVQSDAGRTTPLIASSLPSEYHTDSDIFEIDRAEQSRRFVQAAKDYRMKKRSAKGLRDISDLMTQHFYSPLNSARGAVGSDSSEELIPDVPVNPSVERASASTSRQNYAFGINPIPIPRRRVTGKTPPPKKNKK